MSFGRPYIMNIDACIHDGWLTLTEIEVKINKDYLYYILSSNLVQNQFENLATGSTVKNLNKEIVQSVILPIPSIETQKRIAAELNKQQEYIK